MRSRTERRHLPPSILVVAAAVLAELVACSADETSARPVVEVFGNLVGNEGRQFGSVLSDVSADGPVELRYVGVTSFNQQLANRLDKGDRPAIALVPQPGRLHDLDERGLLVPIDNEVVANIRESTPSGLVDLVTIDGDPAAVWLTVDVKGLVWYRPSIFEERQLAVPTTLDDFVALAAAERNDGDQVAPFCLDAEAGASTGWVGTDWVESFVLRRLGPDVYDAWTFGELAFDSREIRSVFEELDVVLRSPGAVAGGTAAGIGTPWADSADRLLGDPPRCLMVHQGDFLRREFPPGTVIAADGDVDFFALPSTDGRSAPLVLGGLLAAPLDDEPGVNEAMALLASDEVAERLVGTGLFLSPNAAALQDSVNDPVARRLLELVTQAETVRFDGSDLMVSSIGTGTFWDGMRSFLTGADLDAVLATIEDGRP